MIRTVNEKNYIIINSTYVKFSLASVVVIGNVVSDFAAFKL